VGTSARKSGAVSEVSPRRSHRRALLLSAVAVGAVGLSLGVGAAGALGSLELDTVDARFKLRGARTPRSEIVLVALDGRSVSELGLRPPLPRSLHARALDRLRADRPRVIAYDLQFIGRTEADEDRAVVRAIRRANAIVLATHDVRGSPLRVPAGRDAERLGARVGTVGLLHDADGKIRRTPYTGTQSRSFSVVAADRALGRAPDPRAFPAWIDYAGPPGTFPAYSLSRLLAGDVPPGSFRNKLVVVGATDPIERDIFATPASRTLMSGAELNANVIATILNGFPLASAPAFLDYGLVVLLGVLVPVAALGLRTPWALAVSVTAFAGLLVAAQLSFNAGTIIAVSPPALALALGAAGAVVVDLLTSLRERQRIRRVFSRFVPDQVVEDVLRRTDDDLRLGGVTLEATVLFCDLRGFTSFAEGFSGATVIDVLNRYLTEMSEAILEHGGTIVAYLGDGIMAVFGAPIEQTDHADRAVAAAREMLGVRLERFNAWLAERGLGEGFGAGIGLCSGPVRSGNVGSDKRIEYAAVGDTTNVAARLQATTKETGHALLMAEATRAQARRSDDLVYLGEYLLPGRSTPTRVWSVSSPGERGTGDAAPSVPPPPQTAPPPPKAT